jgi:capsular exopolysaccharide synthesis family protein
VTQAENRTIATVYSRRVSELFSTIRTVLRGRRLPFRRIVLVAAAAVVGGLVAALLTGSPLPTYRATAQLYVAPASNPTSAYQDVYLGQTLAASYAQLATADVVLRPAMERTGFDNLNAFRALTEVAQLKNSPILLVSFRSGDAQRAAEAANAIAESFITQSRNLQTALQGSAVSQLDEQITAVQTDIKSLDAQIGSLRSENAARPRPDLQTQILQLDASRQSKQQTLAQLLKTRDDMRLGAARADNTLYLWQPATPPLGPEPSRGAIGTLVGALAAGALALAAVLAVAYFDDRVRNVDELRAKLKLAPMAEVIQADGPGSFVGKLFLRDEPNSVESEAFRSLRTNVLFANVDDRPRRILVTSALPREGKSVVSANLALAFAQSGTPTILVDADLRRPSLHRLFNLKSTAGLTSLLMDTRGLPSALERFRVTEHLSVIPAGPLPANPAELLSSGKMAGLLKQLTEVAEDATVIVDTSPVLAAPDAVALATMVDGTIFVVDSKRTHARVCQRALDTLRGVHAVILGAVLNNVSTEQAYGYEYYPQSESTARVS